MVSKLEDTLLRCSKGTGRIRAALFAFLQAHDLRRLRVASRTLHDLVDHFPERLFGHLFVNAPWPNDQNLASLRTVTPFCHSLEIVVGHPPGAKDNKRKWQLGMKGKMDVAQTTSRPDKSASQRWKDVRTALTSKRRSADLPMDSKPSNKTSFSSPRSSTSSFIRPRSERLPQSVDQSAAQALWINILRLCQQMRCLTLRAHGDLGWPGRTEIEETLVNLRIALEVVAPPHLDTVRLLPIHAMCIVHLRWSTFGAFGSIPTNPSVVWHSIRTLDLQIHSPFTATRKLSEPQHVMFKKILHDYLRSFATTLKCLHFVWLDDEGPSPVTLEFEPGLDAQREPIIWLALEEIWLGNIELPHRTIRLLPERTMGPVRLKTLRSTHRHSRATFEDAGAWIDVLLGKKESDEVRRDRRVSGASSVYSQ